jgi:anionic cell wall polymer biosynthesis LytR-Cps2A-Psr (LCP) family protein
MAKGWKIIKRTLFILFLIIIICGLALFTLISVYDIFDDDKTDENTAKLQISGLDSAAIKAATVNKSDTIVEVIRVSTRDKLNLHYGIDEEAGKTKRIFTGRRINVAVIGVDSRMNSSYKHADANHVISFLIDEGKIEITAIPRDTPCDAGQEDSTQNKLTVLYPAKGKRAYLKEVAKIANLDRIHYFVEIGFSQAKGILELLGYKNSGSALQVLRSRSALGGDDYQRSYNQAQFIRQMFLKHFDKLTGFFSEVLIRGGLALLNTNITYPIVENILDKLENKKFPQGPDDIIVRIRPPIVIKYKVYNFSDQQVLSELQNQVETYVNRSSSTYNGGNIDARVCNMLMKKINTAIQDSSKRPDKVIMDLKTLFNQRAWLQVENITLRDSIRDMFGRLLYDAYVKREQGNKAEEVKKVIESEKKLFSLPVFETK